MISQNEHVSESLDAVLGRYEGWLCKTARAMVRHAPMYEWEDVAQEGALAVARAYASFNGDRSLDGWIMFKARNAMIDVFKLRYMKDQRVDVPISSSRDVFNYAETWERLIASEVVDFDVDLTMREILKAIAELPEDQQRYVLARFYLGINEREMTQYMGQARPANKYWHGRYAAKKRLAEKLAHLIT